MCYCVIVLQVSSLLSPSVCNELQEADLITSDERSRLVYTCDVVRVQSGKSPEVQSKTADVLRRHGFEKESNLLTGKQTLPLIHWLLVCDPHHVPVVCCTVELSRQIWSPPKMAPPGTKTATKLVPPGTNLVAVIGPP